MKAEEAARLGKPVKSAKRALKIIDFVSENSSMTFAQILESLELPRSSGHGLVQTLVASG